MHQLILLTDYVESEDSFFFFFLLINDHFIFYGSMEIRSTHWLVLRKKSSGKSVFEILASVVYYLNRYDADKV